MIQINDKKDCCGCGACEQRCPQHCISLQPDDQGFLYPIVNENVCVNCKICEKVCPATNTKNNNEPLATFAVINPNEEIRIKSSSGGVFSMLAEKTIEQGGVIFGARFDENLDVIHDYAETIDGIDDFRGSKYVQSLIGDNYRKAEMFLKQGQIVLFSGTPCQIAGLKKYLMRDYENLFSIEVACHGVPSSKVWKSYLQGKDVAEVNFRDKSTGWKDYSVKIGNKKKRHEFNDYMNCFLANFSLRPSCFNCQAKCGKSMADITIADFWGISQMAPDLDDDKGTSAVIVWSHKGLQNIKRIAVSTKEIDFVSLSKYNPAIVDSTQKPALYKHFWEEFSIAPKKSIRRFATYNRPSLLVQMKSTIYRIIHS